MSMAAATDDYRDDDEILKELEDLEDNEMSRIRERRFHQLQKEMSQMQEMRQNRHGIYEETDNEKEVLRMTTSVKQCVVHFYHKDFRRCQIMDAHLQKLCQKHFKTKFVKIEVEKAPFLVEKLKIQVLPCVIAFVDSVSVDRIIGFERLGGTDGFTTAQLEEVLAKSGVIVVSDPNKKGRNTIFGFKEDDSEEESD